MLADEVTVSVTPVLRVRIKRKPGSQEERNSQKLFDERWILRFEPKVSCCKIRITRRDVDSLVIGRGVTIDKEYALQKKQKHKESIEGSGGFTFVWNVNSHMRPA